MEIVTQWVWKRLQTRIIRKWVVCVWKQEDRTESEFCCVILTGAVGAETSKQLKANVSLHTHGAGMDLEDVRATLKHKTNWWWDQSFKDKWLYWKRYSETVKQTLKHSTYKYNTDEQIWSDMSDNVWLTLRCHLQVRQTELDLPVQTSGSHQGWVQCVWSVGGHQNFDVATRVKAVQLVDELQHGPLDLVVSTGTVVKTSAWQVQTHKIQC